jgi:hypothetical protein
MSIVRHEVENREFGRIVGGIGWPAGDKPGYAVIIGEKRYPAVSTWVRHVYLLAEVVDELDATELFRKCSGLAVEYKARAVYGRRDEPMMQFLHVLNREAYRKQKPELCWDEAAHSEEGLIGFHLNIIKRALNPNSKTLHGIEEGRLAAYLGDCTPERVPTATESEFPALAALGYAVAELTIYPPREDDEDETEEEWRPLSYVTGY